MATVRVIARLDIKGEHLIKGIQMEGLRKLGNPSEFAKKYYADGIDEIIYMDSVASLYGRAAILDILRRTTEDVFVPITVGGGIRCIDDVQQTLRAGADKVAVNTAALCRPELLREIAETFGTQCLVLSIEAKQTHVDRWEAYTDSGRERSGIDVMEWAAQGSALGVGEILLTSVDRDGTRKGFDADLISRVAQVVSIPVIASGGFGEPVHLVEAVRKGHADAVAIGSALHYGAFSVADIKAGVTNQGIYVRSVVPCVV